MYYLGQDRAARQRLGVARSPDGVHWEKLRANPILELGGRGAFDEAGLGEPAVWQSHGFYWMLYTGRDIKENRRLGLARSTDGVHWTKLPAVFAGDAALGFQGDLRPHRGRRWRPHPRLVRRRRRRLARRKPPRPDRLCYAGEVNVGITCYPTYGGSGIVATELGLELATRGHEVHFITYANPIRLDPGTPRIHYHEVEVSTYPLFQYPPYCLALASRMAEVAESYELDLLHVHYAIPHSISAMLAQQMLAPVAPPAVHHHAARHRYHAGRRRPIVLFHHQVLHREIRRHHLHQRLPARPDRRSLRRDQRDSRHQELRQLRSLPARQRKEGRRRLRAQRREAAHSPLQLPPREASAGLHSHPRRSPQEHVPRTF